MSERVRLVTGFVPLAGHPKSTATYLELGARLLALPIPKVVWTTGEIRAQLEHERRAGGLDEFRTFDDRFWIHDELEGRSYSVASQNPAKDTLAFHAIQHQKTRWLEQASRDFASDILVWIDFGIFHVPGITERVVADFVGRLRDDFIAIPGCWPRSDRIVLDQPNWRFCGGVLVCPGLVAPWLHRVCVDTFRGIVALHGKVSWEVNTWAIAEMSGRLPIRQYHATTHDERMFNAYEGPAS